MCPCEFIDDEIAKYRGLGFSSSVKDDHTEVVLDLQK